MKKQSGCASLGCSVIALVIVFVGIIVIAPLTEHNKTLPQQPSWYQQLEQQVHKMVPAVSFFSNSISKPDKALSTHTTRTAYTVTGVQSLTSAQIDTQLCGKHSPTCGTGQNLHDLGLKYNIDAVYALAFFWHESNYGTQGVARYSKSIGNLRCIPSAQCVGGYAYFPFWEAGEGAWYQLIASRTYVGSGRVTVAQIVPIYAPAADNNNEQAYIASVEERVDQLRKTAEFE